MTEGERQNIRQRAGCRCEYCRLPDFAMDLEDFHAEHMLKNTEERTLPTIWLGLVFFAISTRALILQAWILTPEN